MTPAEKQQSPVKDIEDAQMTSEREVFQEPNFKGDAIERLGGFFMRLGGVKDKDKPEKNYLPLEQIMEEGMDEIRSKGLNTDDSEYIEIYNKTKQKAFAHPFNYSPSEINDALGLNFGKELMKPVEKSLGTTRADQIEQYQAEARAEGARLSPNATAEKQTSLGIIALQQKKQVKDVFKLLPFLSPEQREQVLSDMSVRSAFQGNIHADYENFLNTNGGFIEPASLQQFKTQEVSLLRSQGVNNAQALVDTTLEPYQAIANAFGDNQAAAQKAAATVKSYYEDTTKMQLYATPITLKDGTRVQLGTLLAVNGFNAGDTLANTLLTQDPNLPNILAKGVVEANVTQLKDSTKQQFLTINGASAFRRAFAPGSEMYMVVDRLEEQAAEEVYAGIRDMKPEQLRQNNRFQAPAEAYYNTHLNVDPRFTTPEQQRQDYQKALNAIAVAYGALTENNGVVLLDDLGIPKYMRKDDKGNYVDATNEGTFIALGDMDAVNARDYIFADARRVTTLGGARIGNNAEAIAMWNETMKSYLDSVPPSATAQVLGAISNEVNKNIEKVSPVNAITDLATAVANAVVDTRTKGLVLPTNAMMCPVNGKVVDKTENKETGLQRISVIDSATKARLTFIGKDIWDSVGDIGDDVSSTETVIKSKGENLGVTAKNEEGSPIDPRMILV